MSEREDKLAEARAAFHSGDHDTVRRITEELFGVPMKDVTKLGAYRPHKDMKRQYTLKEIEDMDPHDKRPEKKNKRSVAPKLHLP